MDRVPRRLDRDLPIPEGTSHRRDADRRFDRHFGLSPSVREQLPGRYARPQHGAERRTGDPGVGEMLHDLSVPVMAVEDPSVLGDDGTREPEEAVESEGDWKDVAGGEDDRYTVRLETA